MITTKNIWFKRILAGIILIILFLPFIQERKGIVTLKPLQGAFTMAENPDISLDTWLDGDFQIKQQEYIKNKIGFRTLFIRIFNQLHFSFFNNARANSVVVGKENYLYEQSYIDAYFGLDYLGRDKIRFEVTQLKEIADTLKKLNKEIIVVLAPGKGSYFPEYFPEEYDNSKVDTTNYEVFVHELTNQNIHLLDFKKWFLSMKETTKYPLYPKTGIHWTRYGEYKALDSLCKYISTITNSSMPEITVNEPKFSENVSELDQDVEMGMNLLFDIKDFKIAYNNFNYEKNEDDTLKVLAVSDSYYWDMHSQGVSKNIFNSEYWYYNYWIYEDGFNEKALVKNIDISREVLKNDVILLISTDANLSLYFYNFIEQLHKAIYNKEKNN